MPETISNSSLHALEQPDISKSQRAMMIAVHGLAKAPKNLTAPTSNAELSIREAATIYGVSHALIYKAFQLLNKDPKGAMKVAEGLSTISAQENLLANPRKTPETAKVTNAKFDIHSIADMIPPMSQAEYESLKCDIEMNGQWIPITLFEDKILDGRYRYKACEELTITPAFRSFEGNEQEAREYSLSLNLLRQSMQYGQRAMYLAREGIVTVKGGKRDGHVTQIANRYGVDTVQLYKAAFIHRHDSEIGLKVLNGEMDLSKAEKLVRAVA